MTAHENYCHCGANKGGMDDCACCGCQGGQTCDKTCPRPNVKRVSHYNH